MPRFAVWIVLALILFSVLDDEKLKAGDPFHTTAWALLYFILPLWAIFPRRKQEADWQARDKMEREKNYALHLQQLSEVQKLEAERTRLQHEAQQEAALDAKLAEVNAMPLPHAAPLTGLSPDLQKIFDEAKAKIKH